MQGTISVTIKYTVPPISPPISLRLVFLEDMIMLADGHYRTGEDRGRYVEGVKPRWRDGILHLLKR